ncbi:cell division protein FtsL [Alkalihalobacterium bogoriense]|uniref:cell division protein FtsL n=1 Tax=Alkalihalobacterium bogoriense TaxID=246272 RepID=UPI00047D55E9|nr:cell division protein FtsL [Alkalihalobacterium bogoriense]
MSNLARQYQLPKESQYKKQREVVKTKQHGITKGEKGLIFLMVIAVFVLVSIIVANYAAIYSVKRDIHNLEYSVQQQTQHNEGLQLQVIELSDPERILDIAKSSGMSLNDDKVKVIQN